jgi:hypothetical protein
VRIVTLANQAEPAVAVVDKTVRTGLQESLAFIAVIIQVTGRLVGSILDVTTLAGVLANGVVCASTATVKVVARVLIFLNRCPLNCPPRGQWCRLGLRL